MEKKKKEKTPEQRRKQAEYYRKWMATNHPDGYAPKRYSGCTFPREEYLSELRNRAYPLPPPVPLTDEQQAEQDKKREERRRKKNEHTREANRKRREDRDEAYLISQRKGQKRWRDANPERAKELVRKAMAKRTNKNQQPNQE